MDRQTSPAMPERSATVVAEAKINLFLRVGDLQESGYHEIQTAFQRIELGDDIAVHVNDTTVRELECRGIDVGPPKKNIALAAGNLYAGAARWPSGFTIQINKRVPAGGGLGGGSADAAAVLRALNHLAPDPLSPVELAELALRLGADVPFLVSGASLALAHGRGEKLRALSPLPVRGITLLPMSFGVNTAAAFGWLDSLRKSRAVPQGNPPRVSAADFNTWDDVSRVAENDFEEVVCERHADLAVVLAAIRSADFAMAEMTGSGSTVFAVSHNAEPAPATDHAVRGPGQILTRTVRSAASVLAE
jgi:4-diphosphocytidyl-2-C-methyl-D-erythritol kinase